MSNDVLMKHIAPGLGCLVAWGLFSSPVQAVLQVRKQKALGSLNPLPYVAMWANCVGWLVYSFITRDIYVLASNEPGLLIATFMTISCYAYADERVRLQMLQGIMFFATLLSLAGAYVSFVVVSHKDVVNIWGSTTVFILLIFYSAPLSVVTQVLRSRSSAGLYLPFAIMNVVNGGLWTLYGLAVPDAFIWAPNMVGAVFGSLQVGLCLMYPVTKEYKTSTGGNGGNAGGGYNLVHEEEGPTLPEAVYRGSAHH